MVFAYQDEMNQIKYYDMHVSDNLESEETWKYLNYAFSRPYAQMILMWRRDGKKFSRGNAEFVSAYVREDMGQYISLSKKLKYKKHHEIQYQLVQNDSCLFFCWDKFPDRSLLLVWDAVLDYVQKKMMKEASNVNEEFDHDKKIAVFTGKDRDPDFIENLKQNFGSDIK